MIAFITTQRCWSGGHTHILQIKYLRHSRRITDVPLRHTRDAITNNDLIKRSYN